MDFPQTAIIGLLGVINCSLVAALVINVAFLTTTVGALFCCFSCFISYMVALSKLRAMGYDINDAQVSAGIEAAIMALDLKQKPVIAEKPPDEA